MHIRKLLAFANAVGMLRKALAPLILGQPDATLDSDGDVALWEVDTTAYGHAPDGAGARSDNCARPGLTPREWTC